MADIIYAQPQQQGGLMSEILPVAILGALAVAAYYLLSSGALSSPLGGSGNGTPSQGTNTGSESGTGTGNANPSAAQGANNNSNSVPTPVMVKTAAGIASYNVNAGPTSPVAFFPGGTGVISYSDEPTSGMIAETLANLQRNTAGITNAWYQQQTLTPLSNAPNAGINSGGSPQSNIPSGVKHCKCTDALRASGICGKNDDWYYC